MGPDPLLFVCPVRPEWTDPTGLTGYFDVLSNRYVVPRFLEAVLVAIAHSDAPVFVVLDEMNLARVEHYFSDVLSCVETGEDLQLHSSGVPIEGTTGTSIPAAVPLPGNLYITGTINVDETTNSVSDKVLDRAVVIDMSKVDLGGFLKDLEAREPALKDGRAAAEQLLVGVHALLLPHGLGFGYRVAEEVVRYHAFAASSLGTAPTDVTDQLLVQKYSLSCAGVIGSVPSERPGKAPHRHAPIPGPAGSSDGRSRRIRLVSGDTLRPAMARLFPRDEASQDIWRVWPDPETIGPGGYRKREAMCSSCVMRRTGADDLLIDDAELEGLRPARSAVARWRWPPVFTLAR